MAITSYPFESQDTTEAQFSKWARELQDTGVIGSYGDSTLRVGAGPGSLTLAIQPGAAFVRGHFMQASAQELRTVSPVAAGAGQRIDAVVMQLDPGADRIDVVVVPGTAGALPTLNQTDTGVWEEPLAYVTILSSGAISVVDVRRFVGSRIGAWSNETRPANPRESQIGFNHSTGKYEFWNGNSWQVLGVDDTGWVSVTPRSVWGGFLKLRRIGSTVWGQVKVSTVTGNRIPTDFVAIGTIPDGFKPVLGSFNRIAVGGYPSTSMNGCLLNYNPDAVTLEVARIGPGENSAAWYFGPLWTVD